MKYINNGDFVVTDFGIFDTSKEEMPRPFSLISEIKTSIDAGCYDRALAILEELSELLENYKG